jgi:mycothiol synthase
MGWMRSRAPVPEDALEILALLVARDIADLGVPDFTLEDLRGEWQADGVDLSADALVIEDERRIVGYAIVRRRGVMMAVAPDRERSGIGTQLLRWAEQRERERGSVRHRQWAVAGTRAEALLRAAGYRSVRGYCRLGRRLDGVAEAAPPAGVGLRPLDRDADAATIYELDAASFAANPDYEAVTFREFCDEHLYLHDLDAGLSRVAEREQQIVGFLLARRWSDASTGFVDLLAVHPRHRHRGIGKTMLRSAFAGFAAAGLGQAQLGVASDNPRAMTLYEQLGMKTRFCIDTYERPVQVATAREPGAGL